MASLVKHCFETPERARAVVREWESLTLQSVFSAHPAKTLVYCLELIISKLSDIKTSLSPGYQRKFVYWNKLLNAVLWIKACKLACRNPTDNFQCVMSDPHASLSTENRLVILPSPSPPLSPAESCVNTTWIVGSYALHQHVAKSRQRRRLVLFARKQDVDQQIIWQRIDSERFVEIKCPSNTWQL